MVNAISGFVNDNSSIPQSQLFIRNFMNFNFRHFQVQKRTQMLGKFIDGFKIYWQLIK